MLLERMPEEREYSNTLRGKTKRFSIRHSGHTRGGDPQKEEKKKTFSRGDCMVPGTVMPAGKLEVCAGRVRVVEGETGSEGRNIRSKGKTRRDRRCTQVALDNLNQLRRQL